MQVVEEHRAEVDDAVAVGVAQQRDAVGARHRGAGALINSLITQPLRPSASSGLGGALVSATSTSPLGSTYSQRG